MGNPAGELMRQGYRYLRHGEGVEATSVFRRVVSDPLSDTTTRALASDALAALIDAGVPNEKERTRNARKILDERWSSWIDAQGRYRVYDSGISFVPTEVPRSERWRDRDTTSLNVEPPREPERPTLQFSHADLPAPAERPAKKSGLLTFARRSLSSSSRRRPINVFALLGAVGLAFSALLPWYQSALDQPLPLSGLPSMLDKFDVLFLTDAMWRTLAETLWLLPMLGLLLIGWEILQWGQGYDGHWVHIVAGLLAVTLIGATYALLAPPSAAGGSIPPSMSADAVFQSLAEHAEGWPIGVWVAIGSAGLVVLGGLLWPRRTPWWRRRVVRIRRGRPPRRRKGGTKQYAAFTPTASAAS